MSSGSRPAAEKRIRSGRKNGFTILYNSMVTDKRLSLKAKGLFAVMMSRPENWEFTVSGLAAFTGAGKDMIRSALAELEEVGYLIREQTHSEKGTFAGNVYVLQDTAPPLSENPTTVEDEKAPLSEKPSTGNPSTEKPLSENPTQSNKDLSNTRYNTPPTPPEGDGEGPEEEPEEATKWKPERFKKFWDFYKVNCRNDGKQKAIRAWDKLKPSDEQIDQMGKVLLHQLATDEWQRGVGIPYASTWLNEQRWKEDPADGPQLRERAAQPPAPEQKEGYGWQ